MHTKLTLRIEEPLVKAAKKYSKSHGKSLSKLIADYLFLITQTSSLKSNFQEARPIARALKGILCSKKVHEKDDKQYLEGKYK